MTLPLPALPDFGAAAVGRLSGRDVVAVLADDHRRLDELCGDLTDRSAGVPGRRRVAEVVAAVLARHLSAEEQYLYPAVRAVVPNGELLVDREVRRDHAVLVAARELTTAHVDDTKFDRLASVVATHVRGHGAAAAEEVLPLLAQMVSAEELVRLGNRVETAREAAPTRPHPSTPAQPPWNRIVDPAVGVVDRVRDAWQRRPTRPQDL